MACCDGSASGVRLRGGGERGAKDLHLQAHAGGGAVNEGELDGALVAGFAAVVPGEGAAVLPDPLVRRGLRPDNGLPHPFSPHRAEETGGVAALPIWIGYMSRALKDVPMQLPEAPEGLVARGEGRDRTYIYAENANKESPADETAQEGAPLPKPDLSVPPSD